MGFLNVSDFYFHIHYYDSVDNIEILFKICELELKKRKCEKCQNVY